MLERILAIFLTTVVLAGCPQVAEIRPVPGGSTNVDELLGQHEYAQVRQLTSRRPELDSPELQSRLRTLEGDYERKIMAEAFELQAEGNLHGAVQLLSTALSRVPHSVEMRTLRNRLEQARVTQLELNEQQALLARGRFLAEQQALYRENQKLAPADSARQRAQARIDQDIIETAGTLRAYAEKAMARDDLGSARNCLTLSRQLHDTPEALALDTHLGTIEQSLRQTSQERANIKRARNKRKQTRDDKQKTDRLLAEIDDALAETRLQDAQLAVSRVPPGKLDDPRVTAARSRVDAAIQARVDKQIAEGDMLYRADRIDDALRLWEQAQALQPENRDLLERTERARKVLARLEQLKQQQRR